MPRSARLKLEDTDADYHLCARAAGRHGEYPLAVSLVRHKLLELIRHYAAIYVLDRLTKLRKVGQYLRRKNPVKQLDGVLFSLREQRSHFVET